MRRQDAGDRRLEFLQHLIGHGGFIDSLFLGNGILERAALVHGCRRDHAARIAYGFHAFLLAWRYFHLVPSARVKIMADESNILARMEICQCSVCEELSDSV